MKNQTPNSNKGPARKNRAFSVLIIVSGVLLLAGIALLLVEPIRSMRRGRITDGAMNAMESVMSQEMTAPVRSADGESPEDIEATYLVPGEGNEIHGEEYDFIGDDEADRESVNRFVASREAKLPKNVTLTCIGVIRIDKINKQLPVWNSTSNVALRYGVGLYEGSVRPGKNGNSAILGHNMKNSTLFSKLYKLEKGDSVEFIRLDGTVLKYRVGSIEIVYKSKLGRYVSKDASENPQLTLVTCANDYGQGNRRVIICHPVSGN